jgi:ribosomal protein L11 methyltransferase
MAPPFWLLTVPASEQIVEGLTNFLWELGALGIVEDETVRAFFPPDVAPPVLESRVGGYLESLRALGYVIPRGAATTAPLADQVWAEAWKAHFQPVQVGRQLLVAAPWNVPRTTRLVLLIEPGRAFGTGHHATTVGCLALLERVLGEGPWPEEKPPAVRRPSVTRALDLGTGSGILAIAAARLGVPEVLAIDSDPDAVAAAVANAARNGVPDRVHCAVGEAGELTTESGFELVTANLLTGAHVRLRAHYPRWMAPGGILILGGILEPEAAEVDDALTAAGLVACDRLLRDGWATLAFRRW